MRLRLYALFGILFLICLAFDALVYGSLAREPGIGAAVAAAARADSPLLHTYIVLGRPLTTSSALTTAGQSLADSAYGGAYASIAAMPDAASSLLFDESHGPLRALYLLIYWCAPLFLALAIVAWLLRSRPTHLIKTARR